VGGALPASNKRARGAPRSSPLVDADEFFAEVAEGERAVCLAGDILDARTHFVVRFAQLLGDHGMSRLDLVDKGSHAGRKVGPVVWGVVRRVVAALVEQRRDAGEVRGDLVGFLVDAALVLVARIPLGRAVRQVECKLHGLVGWELVGAVSEQTVPDEPLPGLEHELDGTADDAPSVLEGVDGELGRFFRVVLVVATRPEALLLVGFDELGLLRAKHAYETAVREHDLAREKLAWRARVHGAHVDVPVRELLHALRWLLFHASVPHDAHIGLAKDGLPDGHGLWFLADRPERVPVQERGPKESVWRRRPLQGFFVLATERLLDQLQEPGIANTHPLVVRVIQPQFVLGLERLLLDLAHHGRDVGVAFVLREKIDDASTKAFKLSADAHKVVRLEGPAYLARRNRILRHLPRLAFQKRGAPRARS